VNAGWLIMVSTFWGLIPLLLSVSFVLSSVSPAMTDYMDRGCNNMLSFEIEDVEHCLVESQKILDRHFTIGLFGTALVSTLMAMTYIRNTYWEDEDEDEVETRAAI